MEYRKHAGNSLAYGINDLDSRAIIIGNCDKIILKDRSFNFEFEIPQGQIDYFDEIIINGVKFKKVEEL